MQIVTYRTDGKVYSYYYCQYHRMGIAFPGCSKKARLHELDADLWGKLWELISVPGKLEAAIETRVSELQAQEFDAEGDCAKLQKQLDDLAMKRQELIVWAQDKIITKDDLALRLTSLSFEQAEAERELRDKSLLVGNRAERLMAVARAYREAVVGGAVDVTEEPETPEEAARVWQFKKTMVEGLVTRVDVRPNQPIKIRVDVDFGKELPDGFCITNSPV